jgi:hypothetical protein
MNTINGIQSDLTPFVDIEIGDVLNSNEELPNNQLINLEPVQELPHDQLQLQELPNNTDRLELIDQIVQVDARRHELNEEIARLSQNDPERIALIEQLRQQDVQLEELNARVDVIRAHEIRAREIPAHEKTITMTYSLILWRMTNMSFLSDLMHIAILYTFHNMPSNVINNIVSKCIIIKLILWFVPFVIRMFVQPYIDYKHISQILGESEIENITLLQEKTSKGFIILCAIIFSFADIIIINQFIPITNSCDPYSHELCTVQQIYSIVCILSYTITGLTSVLFMSYFASTQFQPIWNERKFRLNISSL